MSDVVKEGEIYTIFNLLNGLEYIGQTRKFRHDHVNNKRRPFSYQKRFGEHLFSAKRNPTYHIDRIMKELGPENFRVELIEECGLEELDDREKYWITEKETIHPNGYNIVCGNPHTNCNPAWTSHQLQKYYSCLDTRRQHSLVHLDKFRKVDDANDVSFVEIKPICENEIPKLVYLYIRFEGGSQQRRRYGGKHILFEDAYQRCREDAIGMVTGPESIYDYLRDDADTIKIKQAGFVDVSSVVFKLHKMCGRDQVSIYVKSKSNMTRFVFGGKQIEFFKAYQNAKRFVSLLPGITDDMISFQDALLAKLPN